MRDKKKDRMNLLMYSMLVSMNSYDEHEITMEDIKYFEDKDVADCQTQLYIKVIEKLNNGVSYEEILKFIDELDLETYRGLTNEKQGYLRKKLIKDINSRRVNELKNKKGEVNYE